MQKEHQVLSHDVVDILRHKKCWHVSCGGGWTDSTFQLVLGEKRPRSVVRRSPLKPADEADSDFDKFEGEGNLLVWCSWRLDSPDAPITSSDDTSEHITEALKRLIGQVTEDVIVDLPGWDLIVTFTGGFTLRVFCDHVPGDPSFDGNWDLFAGDKVIAIGVGSKCEIEARTP